MLTAIMEHSSDAGSLVSTRATHRLVEFLLADDGRASIAGRLLSESESWQEALTLAQAWRATPQLFARIQSLKCELTAAETGTLRREYLKVFGQSAGRAAKAITAIRGLEQAGIPVVAFKGIAAMAVLYGDPRGRTIQDADILISRKDLSPALACLGRQGFARRGEETLAEYLQFVQNAPRFAGNQAVALYGENGGEIDLHWDLAGSGLRTEEILGRASRAPLMDATIPVVDPQDGLLLTIHHEIREALAIESVCRDLLDVRLWCHRLREASQLEAATIRASHSGFVIPALAVTSLLSGYDDTTVAAQAAILLRDLASSAERQSAARLIELFHYQLQNGRLGKDVLYLVHSRPWRQILKGLGTNWSGYRRSMQTIEAQVGEEMPLYERVSLLASSIPGRQGLRLARELARVKYGAN